MLALQVAIFSVLLASPKTTKQRYRMGVRKTHQGTCLACFSSAGGDAIRKVLTTRLLKIGYHYTACFPNSVLSLTYFFHCYIPTVYLVNKYKRGCAAAVQMHELWAYFWWEQEVGNISVSACETWQLLLAAWSMKGQRQLLGRRNELIKRSTDFPLLLDTVNVSDFVQRLP